MLSVIIQSSGKRPRHLALLVASLTPCPYNLTTIEDTASTKSGMMTALRLGIYQKTSHILILQEDVVACRDFVAAVDELCQKHPDSLISYFTPRKLEEKGLVLSNKFVYSQAYSLPATMAQRMIDFESQTNRDDDHINLFLDSIKEPHWITNPQLVEHLGWAESTSRNEKSKLQFFTKENRMAGNFIGIDTKPDVL